MEKNFIDINMPPMGAIPIGHRGENDFRAVTIDVSAWLELWPEGAVSVIYRRPDGEIYPVVVNAAASPVVWRPTATDTAVAGRGQLEVRIKSGDVLGKSCTIFVKVLTAVGEPGDVPEASAPDWAQEVIDAANRIENSGIESGYSPSATVTQTDDGAVIEITDKNGTTTATVYNGTDGINSEAIPDYVQTEAEAVARTVNARQSENSFVFAFLADGHCGYYTDPDNAAVKQAAQALQVIDKRCPLDFVVHGGDLSSGAWSTTADSAFDDIEDYTEIMSGARIASPELYLPGNHDDAPYQATADRLTQAQTYVLFGRKNLRNQAAFNPGCNYGYLDFEDRKLRVVYLDTDDKRDRGTVAVGQGETAPEYLNAHNIGWAQLRWLAKTALDFSDKKSPAEWAVAVVSHVALNVSGTATDAVSGESYPYNTANAAAILGAYRKGESGSVTHENVEITYDFSTLEEKAEVYCAVHGHDHKYTEETVEGILLIGCPNVQNGRERVSDDGNTYSKTAGTAEGTSFCVITVDRQNNKIYADHCGAGYDREWEYVPISEYTYTNQIPISTDTDGTVYNGMGYKENSYISSGTGTIATKSGYCVTGFIPCSYKDVINFANITANTGDNYCRFNFYTADKTHICNGSLSSTGILKQVFGDDGNLSQITIVNWGSYDLSDVAYFRFCCAYLGEDSVITVNEEIV